MIHIEKDSNVFEDENLRVATATGDYEDTALIECYTVDTPELIATAFQAQYIRYGNLVYRYSDPATLGAEILAIDPTSTHTAASYVRMTNELLSQMNSGALEATSLDDVIVAEQVNMDESRMEQNVNDIHLDENNKKTSEEELVPESSGEETIQEEVVVPKDESEVLGETFETGSTTPEQIDEVEDAEVIVPENPEPLFDVVPTDIISDEATTTSIMKESSLRTTKQSKVLAQVKKVIRKRKV